MKSIYEGVKKFNKTEFKKYEALFSSLKAQQHPETLFIGCSDSRVQPSIITQSQPGDLFVVRNVANVVPYYRDSGEYLATTAAVEYALMALKVKQIIVCGHSNCGGCRALFMDEKDLAHVPHTRKWLELAKDSRERAKELIEEMDDDADIYWLVEQVNVIEQMKHLMTYPTVKERVESGDLIINGWYFDIGSASVFEYNRESNRFEKIE